MVTINIKQLSGGQMPEKKTAGAACYDCHAHLDNTVVIPTFASALIPLGFALEMPETLCAEIRGRSGLSKNGIQVQFGTVDSDYRGEVGATIFNATPEPYRVNPGDRIAQMKFTQVPEIKLVRVWGLSETERGENGYGSTGMN